MLIDELKKVDNFIIFGAQVVAYGAYVAIKELAGKETDAFVVSDVERYLNAASKTDAEIAKNPDTIEGIPVKNYSDFSRDTFIVVGVTELVQKVVVPMLRDAGYNNLFLLTQHEEHLLMRSYFDKVGLFECVDTPVLDIASGRDIDLGLYEVKNHRDKKLELHKSINPAYEYSIQAGAALTEERIAPIMDDEGINISDRNKKYCEMTATYYVWKNTSHDWKGIEHYRRHLLVSPDVIAENSEVDVFLPLPYICYPNEATQFRRFVSCDTYELLLQALKEIHPEEYNEYLAILQGQYQYTYNLVCAKAEVFDAYCEWFFEITEYMESMENEHPEIRNTRALSYVAEVLTNIYFMSHSNELNIKHIEKEIYT